MSTSILFVCRFLLKQFLSIKLNASVGNLPLAIKRYENALMTSKLVSRLNKYFCQKKAKAKADL